MKLFDVYPLYEVTPVRPRMFLFTTKRERSIWIYTEVMRSSRLGTHIRIMCVD